MSTISLDRLTAHWKAIRSLPIGRTQSSSSSTRRVQWATGTKCAACCHPCLNLLLWVLWRKVDVCERCSGSMILIESHESSDAA
eukprot:6209924-Pleurochrysis_carterae.AAC.3